MMGRARQRGLGVRADAGIASPSGRRGCARVGQQTALRARHIPEGAIGEGREDGSARGGGWHAQPPPTPRSPHRRAGPRTGHRVTTSPGKPSGGGRRCRCRRSTVPRQRRLQLHGVATTVSGVAVAAGGRPAMLARVEQGVGLATLSALLWGAGVARCPSKPDDLVRFLHGGQVNTEAAPAGGHPGGRTSERTTARASPPCDQGAGGSRSPHLHGRPQASCAV